MGVMGGKITVNLKELH